MFKRVFRALRGFAQAELMAELAALRTETSRIAAELAVLRAEMARGDEMEPLVRQIQSALLTIALNREDP